MNPVRVESLENYVRVGEAASIFGVTPKTLRNWDRSGKLQARRHPVNGYRIYLREELEALLNRPTNRFVSTEVVDAVSHGDSAGPIERE
jgi:predicted site-specific integrase-resolvase